MEKKKSSGRSWQITLAVLIGAFIVSTALSMIIAARRVSPVVDPDYYRHGLQYGATHGHGVSEMDGGAVGGKH